MPPISLRPSRERLKQTTTRCPTCRQPVPGEVWREGAAPARVMLHRHCPDHGPSSACLATDARFYWLSRGSQSGGCCGAGTSCNAEGVESGSLGRNAQGRGDGPFEMLSTCLALIEIVRSCNLTCPTCYADSPLGVGSRLDAVLRADIQQRVEAVIARKGKLEILQLSGGEPTLHPEFFELLEWAQSHPKIDYILINTNGLKLAHDPVFIQRMARLTPRRKMQLYLQFDGVQEAAQKWLRGTDLRKSRLLAIQKASEIDLPVTLAMTVLPENLPHIGEAIAFGLAHPIIHGITFQPMFTSGRLPRSADTTQEPASPQRLNTADVLLAAVAQSNGQLTYDDFTPLPCGDPNCATIGYLLRLGGQVHSVSQFLDFSQVQGFLKDRVNYNLEDLATCGCETEPLGEILKGLELRSDMAFRIMVKPFMDAWTWDDDRIDRCCTHVIRPDGKLDSFCRYYSGFPDTAPEP